MKEIKKLLSEAHKYIDGEMNCETAEYRALDKLEQALRLLVYEIEKMPEAHSTLPPPKGDSLREP